MGMLDWLFGKRPEPHQPPVKPAAPQAAFQTARPSPLRRITWREGSYPLEAVGESNYQDTLVSICGRHTREGHDLELEAILEREPTNRYDPNAVMVRVKGKKVGYLSREQAQRVGSQMEAIGVSAVRCRARIQGGWRTNQHDEGHFGVRLAVPTRGEIAFD